ncbi:hypothetical protein C1X64_11470 [Pseudomonas sp. GW456-E7]|nr:hypothetical protein C1X64_11470 [Pseudomonas sp. GW456-E7]
MVSITDHNSSGPENHCGSGLARDDGLTFNLCIECSDLIASKLAPTGSLLGFFTACPPVTQRSTT